MCVYISYETWVTVSHHYAAYKLWVKLHLRLKLTFRILNDLVIGTKQRNCILMRMILLLFESTDMVSVQFSHSVVSDSLQPHELQHARPPCPSQTPGVHSNSCPSSRWCHPTISSLSSPSPPAFNLSQHQGLFKRVSSSHQVAKALEFQLQHQFFQWTFRTDFLIQSGWTGWIYLQSKGLSRIFSNTTLQKH